MNISFFGWRGWQMGFESIDQPSQSSEVEHNPKSNNLFQKWTFHFLAGEGGRWGLSPLTSLANIRCWMLYKNKHFMFLAGEGWWMGFKSIEQLGQSSDVEHNPKMSISFFWVERGGGWGSSPSTNPANHQKLNIIKIWAFHFLAGDRWWMRFKSIDKPGWSLEVEHNTKMSISFLWLERGGGWGLSPLTSPADHQRLNVIQKVAFHFIGWRGLADGVRVHRLAVPIIRSWT